MPGGRPKGASNKNKAYLLKRLEEAYPGYHPVMEMARLANDKDVDDNLRFNANKEVAQYIMPKLKALDITADVQQQIEVAIVNFSDIAATQSQGEE